MKATNNMKQVFVDSHHQSLFSSLCMLFEGRLGWKLYTQAGMAWYEEDLWRVYPHPDTAKQYLLREVEKDHGITREQFKQMDFDLILCSIPQHIEPFLKLAKEKNASLCFQVGNAWEIDQNQASMLDGVMASAKIKDNQPHYGRNGQILPLIEYHQEFSIDLYNFEPVKKTKKIYSFINCINVLDLYKKDWELFLELERLLPEFEFCSYGGQTRNGAIAPVSEVARLTKEADLIFHVKNQGDGFSYGMFTAAACGRPIITRRSDYEGKLAQPLLIGIGPTSIHVDNLSPQDIADQIRHLYEPRGGDGVWLEDMSSNIYDSFKKNVDFDKEEQQIRLFLEKLQ